MSSIVHLAARQFGETSGGSTGISATAIALIVCIGLVPVFIVAWVVIWLLFFYGQDRNCCCVKRKKREADPEMLSKTASDTSQETLNEKSSIYHLPKRPFASHWRTDSGSTTGSGRLHKQNRVSVQSQSSLQHVQEPKRFV